jgi:hypothetical protein
VVEDFQLLFLGGHDVATGDCYPEWKPGTGFRAMREARRSGASN